MADRPDQDDPSERTSTYSFRRKLSEGLTGLSYQSTVQNDAFFVLD